MLPEIGLGLLALYLLHRLWVSIYGYWKDKGVPYLESSFPFGTTSETTFFPRAIGLVYQDIYRKLEPHPYGGIFTVRRPVLILRDPEIIKHVLVKDFSHFRDRMRMTVTPDSPLSQHLFNLGGDKWKALRVKMTPTFTSGKLKMMFGLFQKCSDQLVEELKDTEVEIKEVVARFSTDIIGSCAFGLNINAIKNPENEVNFLRKLIFSNPAPLKFIVKAALYNMLPGKESWLRFSGITQKMYNTMFNMIQGSIDYRQKNNIKGNDFLELLLELKKSDSLTATKTSGDAGKEMKLEMTMDLLLAQCFVFFVAGFETSSSVMSYCLYELSQNTEIQERLRAEVDDSIREHGSLTYQGVMGMAYLDQVVSETIRKYPTLQYLERICTKSYKMPDSDAVIDEGTTVIIPVHGLHHDPKYYPDPDVFDPDRFSPERVSSIPHYAYLPFGEGPRLCIGMRFGLLQTKMGICTLVTKFRIFPTPSTPTKLKLGRSRLITTVDEPIKLKMEKRN